MRYFLIAAAALLLIGCGNYRKSKALTPADRARIQLLHKADSLDKLIAANPPDFHMVKGNGGTIYNSLLRKYGDSAAGIILAINRVDVQNVRRLDTLVIPDSVTRNMLYYSPFPQAVHVLSEIPKIFFISQKIQAFAAYEYGVLVRWGPTSTGKEATPTPNGLFHTNWKAKETISTSNDEWLLKWSFNIDNFNGVSIHQYEMPGYPASHSCTRLLAEDAEWLYYWAQQWVVTKDQVNIIAYGTPVILFGQYDFNASNPCRLLADDPRSENISRDEIFRLTAPYIYRIVQRQADRDSLLASREK